MKIKLLILAFLSVPFWNFGQNCGTLMEPVSLEVRASEATRIIEGEVIDSQSLWDVNHKNIYTIYTVNVYTNMKGSSTSISINVVTMGGQVGNDIQVTSSEANLQVGTVGTFFLKSFTGNLNVSGNVYQMVAAAQGIIKYDKFKDEASDVFNKYKSIESKLYSRIQQATGRSFQTIQARPSRTTNTNKSFLATPTVYSFSPLTATAGTQTVLTITGINFGTTQGSVGFTYASDGGASHVSAADSEIVSWSDTEIQVEIPYFAGTGSIVVTNSNGESTEPNVDLLITYSHLNAIGSTAVYPSVLQDDDGNGGYTFQYHTDFDTSSAKTYFEEAFGLWNCESDINFTFSGTTNTDESVNDGINIVRFDNGSELATGVLGQVTTRFLGNCSTTNRAIVSEMDITWNDSTNWYYGSGTPSSSQYDFKSVALHELGHAHQLGHVIDSSVIMHYSISNGESKYSLNQKDIDGANYTMDLFTQSAGCGVSAMTDKIQCCDTMVITTQPQDTTVEANNGTAQFTVVAENFDTVEWEESGDGGDTWFTITDNSSYSGTTTTTLSVINVPETNDLYYRAILSNICGESLISDEANLQSITYTLIPDANFEAALEALGYDDISGDNKVPTANIENLTSLSVTNAGITDLSGIEDFQDLETLNYSNNSVTTVDLSNNSALRNIAARYNGITTTIDVSANTALEKLFLENNSITSIDLSNNPNLIAAWFQNNNLTSIDVSNNTVLTALGVQNNTLTSLDVSNNTLLAQLYAGSNSITSVDLSNNSNLIIVGLNSNDLSSLNIQNGNNTTISTFSLANNPNLTCILVDDAAYSTTNWTDIDDQTSFSDIGCYIEYTSIPDTNFEAALEVLGYDDISGDGQVPTTLIETVTSLYVSTENISDLTGIEDFTLLQELGVSENSLTSLDLSSNTNLMFLVADDNLLTSINVSNLTNLSLLNIHTNQLTNLDLTSNTGLTEVYIYNNDLQVLDIRNGNNASITSFEATNNTNLSCISVDDAAYSTTNWTSIDAQTNFTETDYCGYTQIPDANFEAALDALGYDDITGDGQVPTALIEVVTNLDVSNQAIADLTGIEDFTSLEVLNISNNTLDDLDFSGNSVIQEIYCFQSEVNSLDISNTSALKIVHSYNNDISTLNIDNASALEELLTYSNSLSSIPFNNNISLKKLHIYSTFITSVDLSSLVALEDLDIQNMLITQLDLSSNINLRKLNANNSRVDTLILDNVASLEELYFENANYFTGALDLTSCSALKTLDITANVLSSIDITGLVNLKYVEMENTSSLSTIDFSTNTVLQTLITGGNAIEYYDLSNNTGLINFTLNYSGTLYVNLQNGFNALMNPISIQGGTNLCVLVDDVSFSTANWTDVPSSSIFNDTYCRYTAIPDANFEAALEALGYDDISGDGQVPTALIETITSLDVVYKSISDLTGIEDFTALTYLDCSFNSLTSIDLSNNIALDELNIESNNLSTIDIGNLTSLTILRAGYNDIQVIDLSNNTSLNYLTIRDNTNLNSLDISQNTLLTHIEASNCMLTSLDISNQSSLQTIILYNNELTTIDFSNNLNIQYIYISGNDFGDSLDFSDLPNLEELEISNCGLTGLNLKNGNSSNILSFEATNNPDLTCILVDDAAYSTTNWTNIDAQTSFSDTYCEYTQIPDANFEAALEALGYDDISGDGQVPTALIESVTTLLVGNKNISDFTGIEDFTSIQSLYVHDNPITTIDLSNNLNLSNFRALRCNLTSLDLSTNASLSYLDITDNNLTELNLANNIALTTLVCPDNLLSSLDVSHISVLEELEANNNLLTSLTLGTHDDLVSLLLDNNELTELDLSAYPNLEYAVLNDNNLTALNLQSGSNQYIYDFDITNNPNLICVLVDNAAYSTLNWTDIDAQTSFNETSCDYVIVDIDVFLQGALLNPNTGEESLMRDDLRVNALIDNNSPYSDNQVITETINLDDNGSDSMVDWIWVELRDATDPTLVISGQSAILQRDGDVVSNVSDLATALTFNVTPDDYYVVVSHRNHLGIMTANAITLNQSATTIDFTDANNQITYGSNAQTTFGMPTDIVAMWAGDVNGDGIVQYSGTSPDTPDILSEILNDSGNFLNFPTYTINGYNDYDANLDGETQYSGTNPDVPYILQNVLAYPGNSLNFSTYQITEQLP